MTNILTSAGRLILLAGLALLSVPLLNSHDRQMQSTGLAALAITGVLFLVFTLGKLIQPSRKEREAAERARQQARRQANRAITWDDVASAKKRRSRRGYYTIRS